MAGLVQRRGGGTSRSYYHLAPGDLIYTGTPAGVGAVLPGDHIHGGIDGLPEIQLTVGPAE